MSTFHADFIWKEEKCYMPVAQVIDLLYMVGAKNQAQKLEELHKKLKEQDGK